MYANAFNNTCDNNIGNFIGLCDRKSLTMCYLIQEKKEYKKKRIII